MIGMVRPALAPCAALLLASCGTAREGPVRIVTVNKPVAVACVPAGFTTAPEYPDTDEALRRAPDAAERYRLVFAGRLLRDARLGELEPVIEACQSEVVK